MIVIGVMGPSYCGSTVVGLSLGRIGGVVCAGEVHRLVTREKWGGLRPSKSIPDGITERFKEPFPYWYRHLGGALGAWRAFVITDKVPSLYRLFSPPPDIIVFPYKDPRSQVASFIRHNPQEERNLYSWIKHIVEVYQNCIHYTEYKKMPVVSLSMEDLAYHPRKTLKALAEALGLPYQNSMLHYWTDPPLTFGGNEQVNEWNHDVPTDEEWEKRFYRKFGRDDRWKTELSPAESSEVIGNNQIQEIQAWLLERKVS